MVKNVLKQALLLTASALFLASTLQASVINVRDLGAKGDGKTDDTEAVQAAINKAGQRKTGGVLLIPAGQYLISKTLKLDRACGLIVRGQGAMGYKASYSNALTSQSTLIWNGQPGGVLFHSIGCFGNSYENLAFSGIGPGKTKEDRASILFLTTTVKGTGNMVHRLSNMSFSNAGVGIQMGSETSQSTNDSDFDLESIYFGSLDSGFKTMHDQAVDYTFSFVFALNCETIFDIQKGGNLLVNTAQLTNCNAVLYIGTCGFNNGSFLLNNVRLEAGAGHLKNSLRCQLLRTSKNVGFANIRFNNYCDAQWFWFKQSPQPKLPLCEINAGAYVEFSNSLFQGPTAVLNGSPTLKARLNIHNSAFRFITPDKAVTSNEFGYYKLIDNMTDKLDLFPNTNNWSPKK